MAADKPTAPDPLPDAGGSYQRTADGQLVATQPPPEAAKAEPTRKTKKDL